VKGGDKMARFQLLNGKQIDEDMVEQAMEDSDLGNTYYLNTETGEVTFISDSYHTLEEQEKLLEEVEGSEHYVLVERISSHEAYQWMEDFVAEVVEPKNKYAAEKLAIALMGKGAFRRFKDVLHSVGDEWVQAWYQWRDNHLKEAMYEWFESLSEVVVKVEE
jgi:hypothetical protein